MSLYFTNIECYRRNNFGNISRWHHLGKNVVSVRILKGGTLIYEGELSERAMIGLPSNGDIIEIKGIEHRVQYVIKKMVILESREGPYVSDITITIQVWGSSWK